MAVAYQRGSSASVSCSGYMASHDSAYFLPALVSEVGFSLLVSGIHSIQSGSPHHPDSSNICLLDCGFRNSVNLISLINLKRRRILCFFTSYDLPVDTRLCNNDCHINAGCFPENNVFIVSQ